MNNKFLSVLGLLLVISMLSFVSGAVTKPARPDLVGDLTTIDWDFRVPVFPSLTITGVDVIAVGGYSNHDFEISVPYSPDKDISDLTYSWFFGVWAVMDDSGNVVVQIPEEVDLGTSNISKGEIKHVFTEGGIFYYVPAMLEVKQEFLSGGWTTVSEEVIEKEAFKINVAGVPGTPGFIDDIGAFFNRIWSWILSWFG